MQEVHFVFLATSVSLPEPSVNFLLSSLKDAPVFLVVMAFFIIWVSCWLPIAALTAFVLKWQPSQLFQPEKKLPLLVSLYLLAPLILWGISWITDIPFSDYGFIGNISTLYSLVLGLALGILSITLVFSWQLWLGWCFFQWSNIKLVRPILLPIFLVALFVGGIEELIFRGFLFTELEKGGSVWLAALISSSIFALLHLVWEQKETIPQLPGLWFMGMVLILARFVDGGSIGLAWGLHAGWIWAIATIDTAALIDYTGNVCDWVTGKNKKPLAGVAGVLCLLITGGVLWLWAIFQPK
ncbi:type II CAAX endopeptidase family protein [Brasilonema sp. UFV-L1]|uniref:CPBP family intramembrane glutamic endopeptidase n=1 Tax=Brasilonema sp. UFV-L1 TaxID=2234130 RepID=UPI00145C4AE7|nr:type II CAAX endopeptidase family protein [Brasilonema sp. UFV-L1]NMG09309.1 CPBP family intramembrane metalloprotease domain-containing protein [Brasilonema sp. UFV-L1]